MAVMTDAAAELEKVVDGLDPKIRGLIDLPDETMSNEIVSYINEKLAAYSRRRSLCLSAGNAIRSLIDDGYPDLNKTPLPGNLYEELQGEKADLIAAFDEFVPEAPATKLSVDLGKPTAKEK